MTLDTMQQITETLTYGDLRVAFQNLANRGAINPRTGKPLKYGTVQRAVQLKNFNYLPELWAELQTIVKPRLEVQSAAA